MEDKRQRRVWNKRDPHCPKDAIYIGRPGPYGNPYSHLKRAAVDWQHRTRTREEAIALFIEDMEKLRVCAPMIYKQLCDQLRGHDFACWCAPFGGIGYQDGNTMICHGQYYLKITRIIL